MTTSTESTAATTHDQHSSPTGEGLGRPLHRRLGRAATVLASALVTMVSFLLLRAAGADFTITDPGEGKVPHTFVAVEIAIVTGVLGLLGWVTLAGLERWTRRARTIWISLAAAVVLVSLVPIWIEQATTQTRFSLAVVHVVVGLSLLPLLRFGRAAA